MTEPRFAFRDLVVTSQGLGRVAKVTSIPRRTGTRDTWYDVELDTGGEIRAHESDVQPFERKTTEQPSAGPDLPVAHIVNDVAGKDSPTGAESTLSSNVIDLLTAIRDALDVPLPGPGQDQERAFHLLMENRRSAVYSALRPLLAEDPPRLAGHETRFIRRRTAALPVTSTVWADPEPAERNGGAK